MKNLDYECMNDYHINIFYSEDDEGHIADIPDLQACSAFGKTPFEALQEVENTKQAWLESAKQEGKPIPHPTYRPVIYQVMEWMRQAYGKRIKTISGRIRS
jgi:predicted RNase H-like HicB family nuclease